VSDEVGFYRTAPRGAQLSSPHQQEILQHLAARAVAGRRLPLVLDVGSGRGSNLATLLGCAQRVIAVDVSEEALREARDASAQTARSVAFVVASATDLPFRSSWSELTVCTEVLEHVPALDRAAAELERVTAPSGHLLISTPNYRNVMGLIKLWKDWRSGTHDFDPWKAHRGGFEGFMTVPRLRRAFRDSLVVTQRGADYAFALGIRSDRLRRRLNRYLLLRPGHGRLAPWGMQYYLLMTRP